MQSKIKVAVIGGGSWATAIVKMLCENMNEVGWYMRSNYIIEHIKRNKHNPNYLSSANFDPNKLFFSEDINEMIAYADYLIFAVPSAFVQAELDKVKVSLEDKVIFSAIKGIVPESGLIVGEHFNEKMKLFDIKDFFFHLSNSVILTEKLSLDIIIVKSKITL